MGILSHGSLIIFMLNCGCASRSSVEFRLYPIIKGKSNFWIKGTDFKTTTAHNIFQLSNLTSAVEPIPRLSLELANIGSQENEKDKGTGKATGKQTLAPKPLQRPASNTMSRIMLLHLTRGPHSAQDKERWNQCLLH